VTTLYDAIPLMRPEWANPRLRRTKNWLLRAAAANADRVIAISGAAVAELVEHYRVDRARVRVVHLGVAKDWFEAPSPEVREHALRLGLQPGYFLFVGTLQPRKNVSALLQAYDRLPADVRAERQLVIVGKYGWGAESLRVDLEARRTSNRVRWLEYLDRDLLRAVYRDAGVFVFPSLAEGFGLPVLEALASGVPVVASDLPVVREVADEFALLAPTGDVDALADAMAKAVHISRAPEADAQRQAWARRFDWRTCAERTIDVYREVVED
jgi:alpha-1,3-rhamnosyl/mannosyltransferase